MVGDGKIMRAYFLV